MFHWTEFKICDIRPLKGSSLLTIVVSQTLFKLDNQSDHVHFK